MSCVAATVTPVCMAWSCLSLVELVCLLCRCSFRWRGWRWQRGAAHHAGAHQPAGWVWPPRQHQSADGHKQAWHSGPSTDEAWQAGQEDRVQPAWSWGENSLFHCQVCSDSRVFLPSVRATLSVSLWESANPALLNYVKLHGNVGD